jgi:DNA-binding transcriptional regulator YdaS (Cro superfamily)
MSNAAVALRRIGLSRVARACGVSYQAVQKWERAGRIPADRCASIEAESGARCEDLRPDLTWHRDAAGQITGYTTPVPPATAPQSEAA